MQGRMPESVKGGVRKDAMRDIGMEGCSKGCQGLREGCREGCRERYSEE